MLKDVIVRFDTTLTIFIQQWPSWLHTPMLAITNVGQPVMMGLVAILTIIYAWQHGRMNWVYGMGWAMAAMIANGFLKHYIHRTRPDTLYVSNMYFQTSSFPSGHAFGATVICGILAYLCLQHMPEPWNWVVAAAFMVFILLVGISRVYVGAHYPTDVIAGWVLGAIVVVLIVIFAKL